MVWQQVLVFSTVHLNLFILAEWMLNYTAQPLLVQEQCFEPGLYICLLIYRLFLLHSS